MARIMVVDDEELVVDIVGNALRKQNHVIVSAYNGQQAIELLQRHRLDLVILDIIMPGLDGLQVCRFMRRHPKLASIPVIFLTARERIEDRIAGLEAGADDYLSKPFNLIELQLRVKALLRRAAQLAPAGMLTVGRLSIDPDSKQALVNGKPLTLTPMEFELLYYLVSHAGEVITAERLLQEVWAYPPGTGSPSLVRMHVLNLRRKLEQDPGQPAHLRTIPRHGYVLQAF
ncbi:MAG: response regulator transcription factor [Actinobacteria bacterium]|nr:response regulator transcription factor [Actinomycetota bacterium]